MLIFGTEIVDKRGFPRTGDVMARADGCFQIPYYELISDIRRFFTPLESLALPKEDADTAIWHRAPSY